MSVDDPGGLQALDVGGADGADEVRVLADGLLDAAPADVAHDVEDGRQTLVDADGAHVTADGGGHAPHQAGVEGGAPGQRDGVGGGAPGGEAGQALVVREGGDAEAVGGGDPGLGAGQGERAEGGVDRDGAERSGQLAESVGQERVEIDGLLHLVLVGGHFAALVGGAGPCPDQLCGLLQQGHGVDQRVDACGDGGGRVVPEGGGGGALRGHVGVHFPPPPAGPPSGAGRACRWTGGSRGGVGVPPVPVPVSG